MKFFKFIASILIFFLVYVLVSILLGIIFRPSQPYVFSSESMYVIDKVLLYSSSYYLPFIISYFALSKVLTRMSFKMAALDNLSCHL